MDVEGSEVINNLPSPGRRGWRGKLSAPAATAICISGIRRQQQKKKRKGETVTNVRLAGLRSGRCVTCFGVDGEVGLAVQDAVHHPGAVAVGGVVGVRGRHLRHVRPCRGRGEGGEGRGEGSVVSPQHGGNPPERQ